MTKDKELSINLRPEVISGKYSNLAIISHSKTEFIIDFASMLPGLEKADVQSRIIMNPEHAKRLLLALSENVSKYEAAYGNISFDDNAATIPFPTGGTRS